MPDADLRQEREATIAHLEARQQRRSFGVRTPTALVAMAASAFLLSWQAKDVAYFFSPRAPITLGVEGEYRLERLRSNRYAQVHGIPTLRGAYAQEGREVFVVVGLLGTPLLVKRPALPGEEWTPGRPPPQPDQRPFGVRGRLLAEQEAPRYAQGVEQLRAMGEVQPLDGQLWLLLEGEQPASALDEALLALGLAAFFVLNGVFLVRDLRSRSLRRRTQPAQPGAGG
jgi:hypothetical protein